MVTGVDVCAGAVLATNLLFAGGCEGVVAADVCARADAVAASDCVRLATRILFAGTGGSETFCCPNVELVGGSGRAARVIVMLERPVGNEKTCDGPAAGDVNDAVAAAVVDAVVAKRLERR